MFELMLAETFANAAILCTLLYLIAKHEADFSFAKVAMVVAAIQLAGFLTQAFLFERIGWFTLAVSFVLALLLVNRFCWLNMKKTLLVVILFCIFQAGTKIGMTAISAHFKPQSGQIDDSELGDVVKMLNAHAGAAMPSSAEADAPEKKEEGLAQWKAARAGLKLGGVMLNDEGGYVAIVNGNIVEVGDIVKHEFDRLIFRWKVAAISKHDIDFTPLDVQPK